ncbi:MAG: response regulator [Elusimicrobia bacterium]|nr:response regulator [Elusimicrobiota bacterium]
MAEVLVVDDDADVRKMMAAILDKAGHKVSTCASGQETLKELGIQPNDASVELPDLLVLDIMMPKSDGYTVGTAIRNNPRTRGIPILVVSALHDMSRLFTATVQVDGFLTKPFDPADLIGNVAKILDKRRVQG